MSFPSLSSLAALRRIGLAQPLLDHIAPRCAPGDQPMRVVAVQRDHLRLHDGAHEHRARMLPALAQVLREAADGVAVGDWVIARRDASGEAWVRELAPALNRIARRDAEGARQPLVANVDHALLVMGLDADFNLRRLDRYLTLAALSRVQPVVVLTKADLCADLPQRRAQAQQRVPPGVAVVDLNALDASAAAALQPWLGEGTTLVLLGSSGAGKSSLTNTLVGAAVARAGAVREDDSRGRHTTTVRTLHRCPGGACIIDTPGLRMLHLDADSAQLRAAFDDVASAARQCRFRNCSHQGEPGCAVREQVAPERLRNFHKLLREAQRDEMTVLERREQIAQWKARGRAARMHLKAKRGEPGA